MSLRILITGASSGVGREAALQLAQRGHRVVLASRGVDAGRTAAAQINAAGGCAEFRMLDLADLDQVRRFAAVELSSGQALDVLLCNAGLLAPVERETTRQGFELLFGTAHLGHFALTGLLMPALLRSRQPRVISVSSVAHAYGRIDFSDLHGNRSYHSMRAYTATKLACLIFAVELQRRAATCRSALTSVAAHPGIASTPIAADWRRQKRQRLRDRFDLMANQLTMRLFSQSAADGALPLVHAACETVVPGGYYGPLGWGQMSGAPGRVRPSTRALDREVGERLWAESERLTGVVYPFEVASV